MQQETRIHNEVRPHPPHTATRPTTPPKSTTAYTCPHLTLLVRGRRRRHCVLGAGAARRPQAHGEAALADEGGELRSQRLGVAAAGRRIKYVISESITIIDAPYTRLQT